MNLFLSLGARAVIGANPGKGVNLASMELMQGNIRSNRSTQVNYNYTVPRPEHIAWLAAHGMTRNRLPFEMEMLSPCLHSDTPNTTALAAMGISAAGDLHPKMVTMITDVLNSHAAAGSKCLLDCHIMPTFCYQSFTYNSGAVTGLSAQIAGGVIMAYASSAPQTRLFNYPGTVGTDMTTADFQYFWKKIAAQWGGHPGLAGYGLGNEPHNMPNSDDQTIWNRYAQDAINAIRTVDLTTPIYVSGNEYEIPWGGNPGGGFTSQNPNYPLSGTNLVYEMHFYLDHTSSGALFDWTTESTGTFSAGESTSHAATTSTGNVRATYGANWVSGGHTVALTEIGMPQGGPALADLANWQTSFIGAGTVCQANNIEMYVWAGGDHWTYHAFPINAVPDFKDKRTWMPLVLGALQNISGNNDQNIFADADTQWGPSGTVCTVTVYNRGNLTGSKVVNLTRTQGAGTLSASTVTLAAGANTSATFTYTTTGTEDAIVSLGGGTGPAAGPYTAPFNPGPNDSGTAPASTDANGSTTINNLIAATSGSTVTIPGNVNYTISAPINVPSGKTLTAALGTTVFLTAAAGYTGVMLNANNTTGSVISNLTIDGNYPNRTAQEGSTAYAIAQNNGQTLTIQSCHIFNCPATAINIYNSPGLQILNNNFQEVYRGIFVDGNLAANSGSIMGNQLVNTTAFHSIQGFEVIKTKSLVVKNNRITGPGVGVPTSHGFEGTWGNCLYLWNQDGTLVENNQCQGSYWSGIVIGQQATNFTCQFNHFEHGTHLGTTGGVQSSWIEQTSNSGNLFTKNTLLGGLECGNSGGDNLTITYNTITVISGGKGINCDVQFLHGTVTNNTIKQLTDAGTDIGIYLWQKNVAGGVALNISNNSCEGFASGIEAQNPGGTGTIYGLTIQGNKFTACTTNIKTNGLTIDASCSIQAGNGSGPISVGGDPTLPSDMHFYSMDPVTYWSTDQDIAGRACLAKYKAIEWLANNTYTDLFSGAVATVGQNVRAVYNSAFADYPACPYGGKININPTYDGNAYTALPQMGVDSNGKSMIDFSIANNWGFIAKKVVANAGGAGTDPSPTQVAAYNARDSHFMIVGVNLQTNTLTGTIAQTCQMDGGALAQLNMAAGKPVMRFVDGGSNISSTAGPSVLGAGAAHIVSYTSVVGAQSLRVDGASVATSSFSPVAASFNCHQWGFDFSNFYTQSCFGGKSYGFITGKGTPNASEMLVMEQYLARIAGTTLPGTPTPPAADYPAGVAGLTAWFDPSRLDFLAASSATGGAITVSGQVVGEMDDRVVSGPNLTVPDANRFIIQNVGALWYLDTGSFWSGTTGGGATTAFYLSVGWKITAGFVNTLWCDRTGANNGYELQYDGNQDKMVFSVGTGAGRTTVTNPTVLNFTSGGPYVITAWDDGTKLNLQINNGTVAQSATHGAVTAGGTVYVGQADAVGTNQDYSNKYGLIWAKNSLPNSTDRAGIKTFMGAKVGLTL